MSKKNNYVVLLGAGFSRNWGGWLAREAFDYLLGCLDQEPGLKDRLFDLKDRGGFEAALDKLQEEHVRSGSGNPDPQLMALQDAIVRMFADMDKAFSKLGSLEFQSYRDYQVGEFLARFDAICTLNQDLLLERHYLLSVPPLAASRKWTGVHVPMMRPVPGTYYDTGNQFLGRWQPDPDKQPVNALCQPYLKLHGSTNWGSNGLLVLGGSKKSMVERDPVLKSINAQFKSLLLAPNTRLMVIGYSFLDDHINEVIREAAARSMKLFIIDPLGVDAMDKGRISRTGGMIPYVDQLAVDLRPHVIGASTRSLKETFGTDAGEHAKIMRFFD